MPPGGWIFVVGTVAGLLGLGALVYWLTRRPLLRSIDEQAARYHAIVEAAVDAIITIDRRGCIESANPAVRRVFGYEPEELLGRNVSLLMPAPYEQEHDGYIERYLRTREARIIGIGREAQGRRKDGTVFPIDLTLSEIWCHGEPVFTGIVRDITERHQFQAQICQQEKLAAVGQLAAGVAHEVGNPLASISMAAQVAARRVRDPYVRDKLDHIFEQIQCVSGILRQMVDLSRPPTRQWQRCDLNALVSEAYQILQYDARDKHVRLSWLLAEGLPPVWIMPDQIQLVFINIMLNAFDALAAPCDGRAPHLQVATRRLRQGEEDEVAVVFEDNGPGMDETAIRRALEPFHTTKGPGKGTGLGLAISHSIVHEHGGRLVLDGRPGKGAYVEVRLSIREQPPAGCIPQPLTPPQLPSVYNSTSDDECYVAPRPQGEGWTKGALVRLFKRVAL